MSPSGLALVSLDHQMSLPCPGSPGGPGTPIKPDWPDPNHTDCAALSDLDLVTLETIIENNIAFKCNGPQQVNGCVS